MSDRLPGVVALEKLLAEAEAAGVRYCWACGAPVSVMEIELLNQRGKVCVSCWDAPAPPPPETFFDRLAARAIANLFREVPISGGAA